MNATSDTTNTSITKIIALTAECTGLVLSDAACVMMAGKLSAYPEREVIAALNDCMETLKGRLTLADILERLKQSDSHPEPDEAWVMALASENPSSKEVITVYIKQAFTFVKPALDIGDKFGARSAFVARYKRLVSEARAGGTRTAPLISQPAPQIAAQRIFAPTAPVAKPESLSAKAQEARAELRAAARELLNKNGTRTQAQEKQNAERRAKQRERAANFEQLEKDARDSWQAAQQAAEEAAESARAAF